MVSDKNMDTKEGREVPARATQAGRVAARLAAPSKEADGRQQLLLR